MSLEDLRNHLGKEVSDFPEPSEDTLVRCYAAMEVLAGYPRLPQPRVEKDIEGGVCLFYDLPHRHAVVYVHFRNSKRDIVVSQLRDQWSKDLAEILVEVVSAESLKEMELW